MDSFKNQKPPYLPTHPQKTLAIQTTACIQPVPNLIKNVG